MLRCARAESAEVYAWNPPLAKNQNDCPAILGLAGVRGQLVSGGKRPDERSTKSQRPRQAPGDGREEKSDGLKDPHALSSNILFKAWPERCISARFLACGWQSGRTKRVTRSL